MTNSTKSPAAVPGTNPKDLLGIKKPPLSLVPPVALIHCSMAMKNGMEKYGAYNFRETAVQALIYADAAQRHILSWIDGEEFAADSGVHHLGHAMACAAILLDAQSTGMLADNRPPRGRAAQLIAELTIK